MRTEKELQELEARWREMRERLETLQEKVDGNNARNIVNAKIIGGLIGALEYTGHEDLMTEVLEHLIKKAGE